MCRHLGYLGPRVAVGSLLTRGPHSLYTQSWQPRDMRGGGTINADGFGVAWWVPAEITYSGDIGDSATSTGSRPDRAVRSPHLGAVVSGYSGPGTTSGDTATDAGGPEPPADASTPGRPMASRYRNAAPIWTDPAVSEVLPQLHSTAVLAAVRSATVGMPVERAACAPFTAGRWAFSHNGKIADWQRVLTEVAAEFGSPPLLAAEARTDSAALWVILHGLLENSLMPVESASATAGLSQPTESEDTTTAWRRSESSTRPDALAAGSGGTEGPDPAEALRRLLLAVLDRDPAARLNLLLGDGETLWATTRHHSLSVLVTDEFAVASSEPYDDDPRWRAVPDRQLVTLRPGLLSVVPLDPDATG